MRKSMLYGLIAMLMGTVGCTPDYSNYECKSNDECLMGGDGQTSCAVDTSQCVPVKDINVVGTWKTPKVGQTDFSVELEAKGGHPPYNWKYEIINDKSGKLDWVAFNEAETTNKEKAWITNKMVSGVPTPPPEVIELSENIEIRVTVRDNTKIGKEDRLDNTGKVWSTPVKIELCPLDCIHNDDCCPEGCDIGDDNDCAPRCGDEVVTTPDETCDTGIATGQLGSCPTQADCDDPFPCTIDTLQNEGNCIASCLNTPITECKDNDTCCLDRCNSINDSDCSPTCGNGTIEEKEKCDGNCPMNCADDGNVCTTESLEGSAGNCTAECVHSNVTNGTNCGSSCNGLIWTPVTCQSGICTTGSVQNCDDGNPCTTDACVAVTGCVHTNVTNGTECGPSCSDLYWIPKTCQSGSCTTGVVQNCDDGNACTTDACVAGAGCVHSDVSNGTNCGSSCSGLTWTPKTCQSGTCTNGSIQNCDDGSACTTDACTAATGCGHSNVSNGTDCGSSCSSLNWTPKMCQSGTCTTGSVQNCDDSNTCTNDACTAVTGCGHSNVNNGTACGTPSCSGLNWTHSACQSGTCTAATTSCDNSNTCTTDTCTAATGCDHTNVMNGTICGVCAVCSSGNCAYDPSRNTDCGSCMKCTDLETCGYQTASEDLKDECPVDACSTGYCDNSGSCMKITNITSIKAGGAFSCALTYLSGVRCWGSNQHYEIGDGTNSSFRFTAVDVSGLYAGVTAISAGFYQSCAVTSSGGVMCWGYNNHGQLGDGTTTNRNTPVNVVDLSSGVSTISVGLYHACAITSSGGLKCWGYNNHGQLGDGTTTDRYAPVNVVDLSSGVLAVSAGGYHTCALTSSGVVKCWGGNSYGALGDGSSSDRYTPVNVTGLTSGVSAISTNSDHTCALTSLGAVKCWGYNYDGKLGDGTTTNRNSPVSVVGLSSGVSSISAGGGHTCALTSSGVVKCWGSNDYGQVGDGTTTDRYAPVSVVGLSSDISVLSSGWLHTCALTSLGTLKCWGSNMYAQLGDGTATQRETPVDIDVCQ